MARRKDYRPGGKKSHATGITPNSSGNSKKFQTTDGFENFSASLGMYQNNLQAKGGYVPGNYITRDRAQLDDMYRTSWVVGRIIDVVAEDMIGGGFEIQAQIDPSKKEALQQEFLNRGIQNSLSKALKWGNLYGGALAVILIDGDDLSTPLIIENIKKGSFKGLHVLDRYQVTPTHEKITELGPMLGYPAGYRIHTNSAIDSTVVHHSRVLRFTGVDLVGEQRLSEEYWGGSIVDRVYDRILALDSATHGTANMLFRSFLRTIKIENLRQILASGGQAEKGLIKMFENIRRTQSNEGLTILDAKDDFGTHGWSFAGIYDSMQAFSEQIAGASGVVLVRLLGQSPKGFSTGESDLRTYYDNMSTKQIGDLLSPVTTLCEVCSRSLWEEPLPKGFSIKFHSLYKPTEIEKSQIATADGQLVAGLFTSGMITKAQALAELRHLSGVSGRWASITDEDIEEAKKEDQAPLIPEGTSMTPLYN